MLDTNTLGDLVHRPRGGVARRIRAVGPTNVGCSVVVACELRFGAANRGSARLSAIIEGVLARIEIVPMAPPVDQAYASLRATLSKAGTPIGPNDLFIAAHALTRRAVLVTANPREFSRVPGLALEDWLQTSTP